MRRVRAGGSTVARESAADFDGRSRHVAVFVRNQERCHVTDLLGLGPPPEQRLPRDASAHLIGGDSAYLRDRFGARAPRLTLVKPGQMLLTVMPAARRSPAMTFVKPMIAELGMVVVRAPGNTCLPVTPETLSI